jgi:hypothetical protein
MAFPNIWQARKNTGDDGKVSYSYDGLFILTPDHPSLPELRKAFEVAAREKWAEQGPTILKALTAQDRLPLYNGARKAEYDGFEGNFYISARSKVRPNVKDKDGSTPLTESDGRPYSGCYVNLVGLEIYGFQHTKFGKRICAQLRGLQFLRDGDAFAAGKPADDDEFGDVSDTGESDNPAA